MPVDAGRYWVWDATKPYAMNMDEKYGRPFLMRYFNGVSIQELSEIMGVSPRKLSLWISRAKKKIIDYIQREEDKNE